VASLSVAVVQVTAVALATGAHPVDPRFVVCESLFVVQNMQLQTSYVNAKSRPTPAMYPMLPP
jgi:hypothetical protein